MTADDARFMRFALREARKGLGRTSPNPVVGAVVVKGKKVVGKGYHRRAGALHAEPVALLDAGKRARDATLYVTLEPCNHQGRTAACTQAILKSGIKRVVVGMSDPNPRVAGGGNDFLRAHGVEITAGVLEAACREINLPFIKHVTCGLPWVIMKAGMSLDGKIAAANGVATTITNDLSRRQVHRVRDRVDAILIGVETALVDDPSLTTRLKGKRRRDPLRVVLDSTLRLPAGSRMLNQQSSAPTWVFCGPDVEIKRIKRLEEAGAVVKTVNLTDGGLDLRAVLAELGKHNVLSLLVEGGARVHGSFLQAKLVDQVMLFVAPIFIGAEGVAVVDLQGATRSRTSLKNIKTRRFGDDVCIEGRLP